MRSLSCFLVLVAIIGEIAAAKLLTAAKHTPRDLCSLQESWTLVQDAENCRRFFVCAYNQIEEFHCGEKYYFSAKDMRCVLGDCEAQKEQEVHLAVDEEKENLSAEQELAEKVEEEQAELEKDDEEEGDDDEAELEEAEKEGNEFENVQTQPILTSGNAKCKLHSVQRVEKDCTAYKQCINDDYVSKRCAKDTYFDIQFRSCLPVDISARHQCSCVLPENATLSNPSNCETYYRCEHGIAVLQQCPSEQYYESSVNGCLPDLSGICLEHATMPPFMDDSIAFAEAECKGGRHITASHIANCAKFYLCGRAGVREMSCPLGHYYEPMSRFCHKDVNNMCTGRQLAMPAEEETEVQVEEETEVQDEEETEVQDDEEKDEVIEEFVKEQTEEAAANFNKFSSKFASM